MAAHRTPNKNHHRTHRPEREAYAPAGNAAEPTVSSTAPASVMDVERAIPAGNAWPRRMRLFAIWLLAAVGCLALAVFVAVRWTEKQVLTTDNWVTMVSPLPKNPMVASSLGTYISDQVFNDAAVQSRIAGALPPRADFLAGPLSNQLHTLTTRAAQRLVASDGFQAVWTGANRLAMDRLVATARGQTPQLVSRINERFNLDLSGTNGQLAGALGKASAAIPALQPASQKLVAVSADLQTRPHRVHLVIKTTDFLATVLPLGIIATMLGALAISHHRRKAVIGIAAGVFVLIMVELIALKWLRQTALDQVKNPGNIGAVGYIYDTLVSGLKNIIYGVLIASVVAWLLAMLAGPYAWARKARSYVRIERLKHTQVAGWWRVGRLWTRRYWHYFWLASFLIVLAVVALLGSVTGQVLLNAVLLIASMWALIYIFATPRRYGAHENGAVLAKKYGSNW